MKSNQTITESLTFNHPKYLEILQTASYYLLSVHDPTKIPYFEISHTSLKESHIAHKLEEAVKIKIKCICPGVSEKTFEKIENIHMDDGESIEQRISAIMYGIKRDFKKYCTLTKIRGKKLKILKHLTLKEIPQAEKLTKLIGLQ